MTGHSHEEAVEPERSTASRPTGQGHVSGQAAHVLRLQRSAGNSAVAKAVQDGLLGQVGSPSLSDQGQSTAVQRDKIKADDEELHDEP